MKYHGILSHLKSEPDYRAFLTKNEHKFTNAINAARKIIAVDNPNGEGNNDSRREQIAIVIAADILDIDEDLTNTFDDSLMDQLIDFASYINNVLVARDLVDQGLLVEHSPLQFRRK